MFIRYGIDKQEMAELLGKDVSAIERMDEKTVNRLVLNLVDRGS